MTNQNDFRAGFRPYSCNILRQYIYYIRVIGYIISRAHGPPRVSFAGNKITVWSLKILASRYAAHGHTRVCATRSGPVENPQSLLCARHQSSRTNQSFRPSVFPQWLQHDPFLWNNSEKLRSFRRNSFFTDSGTRV